MPRATTPADSPAQSPYPTPTGAFPFEDTVGICSTSVTGLIRFTDVVACRSLCLRFAVVVASHDARLDSRWLAGPWRGRNRTSWIDEASLGAPSNRQVLQLDDDRPILHHDDTIQSRCRSLPRHRASATASAP